MIHLSSKVIENMKVFCVLLLFFGTEVVAVKRNEDKVRGPFRAVLVSLNWCDNTTYPVEKDSPLLTSLAITSGSGKYGLLSGNVTVLKEIKQIKLKIKGFRWEGDRWKMTYLMKGISCHGVLLDMLCRAVSITMFDASKCTLLKGTYTFSGLDINSMQHLFASKMEYGKSLWRSEMTAGTTTYSCWDFQTLAEPI